MRPNSQQTEVQHYTSLFFWSMVVSGLFYIAAIVTLGWVVVSVGEFFFPANAINYNLWFPLLCAVFVGPLYYLRKMLDRHLSEVRHQLEQTGSSDQTQDLHSRDI
jgi:cytochrome c biogenesis factor